MTRIVTSCRSLALLFLVAAALPIAALAQDPKPASEAPNGGASTPFLWEVQGQTADGTPIEAYLFGTVHLPDTRVLTLAPEVEAAYSRSTAFYSEIETTMAAKLEVQAAAQLPAKESLSALVGPDTWQRIRARLNAKGVPAQLAAAYDRLEPWAVSALLPQLDYIEAQMKGVVSLDETLFARAQKDKKATRGLESVAEQIAVFTAFDRAEQVALLTEGLDQLERDEAAGKDPVEDTVQAWLSGKEERLLDILEASFQVDPGLRKRAEDGLLWERNLRFAERIDGALQASPKRITFIAIGALHMPDPRPSMGTPKGGIAGAAVNAASGEAARKKVRRAGVVTLLRERGYTVTRVEAPVPVGAGR